MMGRRYAERTSVPVNQTRSEVEKLLTRNGATQFIFGQADGHALLAFEISMDRDGEKQKRRLRFLVPMPVQSRSMTESRVAAETRRRWRALLLLLVLKAKLEAVSSNIVTFDQEFLAHIVIEGNTTVGDRMVPAIPSALKTGGVLPPLLGDGS